MLQIPTWPLSGWARATIIVLRLFLFVCFFFFALMCAIVTIVLETAVIILHLNGKETEA